MKITGLTIVPDFGFFGDQLIKGNQHQRYFQMDVVKGYTRPFVEELDNNYVYSDYIDTFKKPSLDLKERKEVVQKRRPTIYLGCDWMTGNSTKNISRVYYSTGSCLKLAQVVSESLEDWGQRYVFGHRIAKPIHQKDISNGDAIRISPFMLNGPEADQYLQRLRELGESLGLSVMIWLNEMKMGRNRYG